VVHKNPGLAKMGENRGWARIWVGSGGKSGKSPHKTKLENWIKKKVV